MKTGAHGWNGCVWANAEAWQEWEPEWHPQSHCGKGIGQAPEWGNTEQKWGGHGEGEDAGQGVGPKGRGGTGRGHSRMVAAKGARAGQGVEREGPMPSVPCCGAAPALRRLRGRSDEEY
jgi:hypothetical protein